MPTLSKPKVIAAELEQAQVTLPELIGRCNNGDEIVITQAEHPIAMLASRENIQVLSNVGGIAYELPFDEGGFAWMDASDNPQAKRQAEKAYNNQFE